jgi:hypothetical protein
LKAAFLHSVILFPNRTENRFTTAPEGKWTPGQHLDHLIKTTRPVNLGFRIPLFIIKPVFGKPNRQERSYDALVEKYKSRLAAGAKAPSIFVPPMISFNSKQKKISSFLLQKEKLKLQASRLTEENLSRHLLPHPLLGKLTLREMLYFTVYHTEHHLAIIKKYGL